MKLWQQYTLLILAALAVVTIVTLLMRPNYVLVIDAFGNPWRIETHSGRVWVAMPTTGGKWREISK